MTRHILSLASLLAWVVLAALAATLAALLVGSPPARAAESYDSCSGYIDSIPAAAITTQGTWCLRHHLTTAITSGNAITVNTNNVTIDCNGFRLGGLPANPASTAKGVYAGNRRNITVRNCNVQGFLVGIQMAGASGGGDVVEGNTLDSNLNTGIAVDGDNNLVRDNRVMNTGGVADGSGYSYGIDARADVIGNTVEATHTYDTSASLHAVAIQMRGDGTVARGNKTVQLSDGQANKVGIAVSGDHVTLDHNTLISAFQAGGVAVQGKGNTNTFCIGNQVRGFSIGNCQIVAASP